MLDYRHQTFLTLCKVGSYTKAAQQLHITQPAVTQHMQFLEQKYGGKLFQYSAKILTLTQRGEMLREYLRTMHADIRKVQEILNALDTEESTTVSFGATLTIGEYVMPRILGDLAESYPKAQVTMLVDNTQVLFEKLRDGTIDFALLEGFFEKAQYDWRLLSSEPFIPVCSPNSPLASREVWMEELFGQRIVLREKGSGTRDILEQALHKSNLSVQSFAQCWQIGNMGAIKQLVSAGHGIAFLYKVAVQRELDAGQLSSIQIRDFAIEHAFHFVFLKNSMHKERYLEWFVRLGAKSRP